MKPSVLSRPLSFIRAASSSETPLRSPAAMPAAPLNARASPDAYGSSELLPAIAAPASGDASAPSSIWHTARSLLVWENGAQNVWGAAGMRPVIGAGGCGGCGAGRGRDAAVGEAPRSLGGAARPQLPGPAAPRAPPLCPAPRRGQLARTALPRQGR
jgi:hypothetical protein